MVRDGLKKTHGGGPTIWILFLLLFNNIIIKCCNVDKGKGGRGQTMWVMIRKEKKIPLKGHFYSKQKIKI